MTSPGPRLLLQLADPGDQALCRQVLAVDPAWDGLILTDQWGADHSGEPLEAGCPDIVCLDRPSYEAQREKLASAPLASAIGLAPALVLLLEDDDPDLATLVQQPNIQDYLVKSQLPGPRLGLTLRNLWQQRQLRYSLETCHQQQTILSQAGPGVNLANAAGQFLQVNQHFCQWLGYSEAELLQLTYLDVTHPDDLAEQAELEKQLFAGELDETSLEKRYLTKDGRIVWGRVTLTILRDAAGNPISDLAIVEDISDRRQLETEGQQAKAELEKQRNLLRIFLDHLPHIAWLKDGEGRFITVNAAFGESCGFSPVDLEGKTDFDIWPEERAHAYRADDFAVIASGQQKQVEEPLVAADGSQRWIDTVKTPIFDGDGELIGTVGIAIDITDRKQAELALHESQARFKGIFEQAAVGICLASLSGDILSANDWFCQFLGYSETELKRMTFTDYSHPDDMAVDGALMQRLLAGEIQSFTMEKRFTHQSGQQRWGNLTVSLVRGTDGTPLYDIAIVQDIDARKQAELRLRHSQEQLQSTLNLTGIGAWSWQPLTGEYEWDGQVEQILDLPSGLPDMFQHWRDRIHPEDVDRVEKVIEQALASRGPFSEEYRYWITEHQMVWRWMQGQGIYDQNGELERVLGVVQDIDSRKDLEQDVQVLTDKLTAILSNTQACITSFKLFPNYTWTYDYYSPGCIHLYGYAPEEMMQNSNLWQSLVVPEDFESVILPTVQRVLAGQTTETTEFRCRHRDGSLRWVSENSIARWDERQQCWMVTTVGIDITDRKQAEAALQENRDFLQTMLDSLPVSLFVKDARPDHFGEFLLVNTVCEQLFGASREQILGKTDHELFPKEQADEFVATDRQIVTSATKTQLEEVIERPHLGPAPRILQTIKVPVIGADQQPRYLLGISQDVTTYKQAEADLQLSRSQLLEAQELAQLGNWAYDLVTGELTWSPEIFRQYGLDSSIQTPTFEQFIAHVHPDDWPTLNQATQTLIATGTPYSIKHRVIRSDGSVRHTFCKGQAIVNGQNQVVKIFGVSQDITETHATELALQVSERKHRALISALPDLIIRMSEAGVYLDFFAANNVKVLGNPQELIGRTIYEIGLSQEQADQRLGYMRQALDTGALQIYRQAIFNGEADVVEEVRIVPSGDHEVLIIVRDITEAAQLELERQQAEASLRASEQRYATLAESSPVGIFRFDAEGNCVYVNSRWCEITGRTLETASGPDWVSVLHPEDRDHLLTGWAEAFAHQTTYSNEGRHLHTNGTVVWFDLRMVPEFDDQGHLRGYIGTVSDISDRKQMESALRTSEERLRVALVAAQMGSWDWDITTNQIVWSESLEQIMGLAPGTFDGRLETVTAMTYPEDRPRMAAAIARSLEEDCDYNIEFRFVKPDGSLRWALSKGSVLRDDGGRPIRMAGVDVDITERKEAEQQIERQNALLAKIAQGDPLPDILNALVREIERQLPDTLCSILLLDADQRLRHGATQKLPMAYVNLVDGVEIGEGVGSCGTAAWRNEPVIVADIAQDPLWQSFATVALDFGLRACWSVPIMGRHGRVLGVFGTYYQTIRAPQSTELQTITQIANLAGIAIERQQAETAIKTSERRYAVLTENSPVGVYQTDLAGDCIYTNPMWSQIAGITAEEAAGPNWARVLHPEDRDPVAAAWYAATAQQTDFAIECRFQQPSGQVRWIYSQATPLTDEVGAPLGYIGTITDITDRKQFEITLQASEAESRALASRLSSIYANAPSYIYEIDRDGVILFVNRTYAGVTEDQVIGTNLVNWFPADQQLEVSALIARSFDHRITQALECDVPNLNGEVLSYTMQIAPVLEQDQVQRAVVIGTDISERKRAELALQQNNQLLSAISHAQTQFITDADPGTLFDNLLETLLDLTHSEYGFIGEILYGADGQAYVDESYMKLRGKPYLKTKAITDISWDAATQKFYSEQSPQGMEFHNLKTLFGQVMVTGQPVLANHPSTDPRRGGLPSGHPPLNAFLGVPFYRGDQLVGMVGLANRPGGYEAEMLHELEPFLTTCASTIEAYRNDTKRKQAERALQQLNDELEQRIQRRTADLSRSEQDLRTIFNNVYDALYLHALDGTILDVNDRTLELSAATREQLIGANIADVSGPDAPIEDVSAILQRVQSGEALKIEWKGRRFSDNTDFEAEVSLRQVLLANRPVILAGVRDISDRKQAEKDLHAERLRLQLALDAANMGTWSCILATGQLDWSAKAQQIFGFEPGMFPGDRDTFVAMLHPDDRDRVLAAIARTFETGCPYNIEYRIHRLDGKTRWLAVWGIIPEASTAADQQLIGVVADITDRKQVEEALRDSEVRFRAAFEQAAVGMVQANLEGCLTQVNQRFCDLLGYASEDLHLKHFSDITHPDDLAHDHALVDRLLTGQGSNFVMEKRYIRSTGDIVWANLSVSLVRDLAGDPQYFIGVIQDISDRKQAEQDLRESRNMLRLVLDAIPQRVFWKDRDFRFVGCNPAFANDYQMASEAIIGKTDAELPWAEWADLYREDDRQIMTSQIPRLNFEEPTTNYQGEQIWIRTSKVPLTNSQGEVIGILGCYDDITERKRAEAALHDSEERLRLALMASSQGLFDLNLPTGQVIVSPAYVTMLGYNPANFQETQTKWLQRLHPEDRERTNQIFQAYIAGEIPHYKVEYRQRMQNGTYKWLLSVGKIVAWDEAGHPLRMIGTHTDINERKQAEAALRESDERFRQIADNINEVFWLATPNHEILYASPAYEQIWGRPVETITSETWQAALYPEDYQRLMAHVDPNLNQYPANLLQRNAEVEYRIVRPDGEIRWIRDRAFAIYDDQGQILRVAGVAEDITERKRLEADQKRLLSVLEASPDHIGIATPDGTLLWNNRQAKRLRGLPLDANVSQLSLAVYHPQWAQDVIRQEAIPTALQRGIWIGETALLTAAGTEIPTSQLIWAHQAETGEIEYLSTIIRDISDIKQAERALRDANADLENRVATRTAELVEAKESAEAANQAKSIFLANMSHELRTPLNAILGFSQLMRRDTTLSGQHLEELKIINRSGEHLLTLINDILEMSKIEAGQATLHPTNFNLPQLLKGLIDMMQLKAASKGLSFTLHSHPDLPQVVYTDSHKLRQVILNLLSNAIKFTQAGYVALRVEPDPSAIPATSEESYLSANQRSDQPGLTCLRFEIEDSGVGIADDELDLLFEPFVQTSSGRLSQEGTGLGLPISYQFVQLLGGTLSVNSQPDVGSTFSFEIPVQVIDTETIAPVEVLQRVVAIAPNQPEYRILVVEDNWANRLLLQNLLTNLGFQVRSAVNGQEALEQWQQWQPHLIFMDIRMPMMNGFGATQAIRQQEKLIQVSQTPTETLPTKIISLTAGVFQEDKADFTKLGFDDLIHKPIQEAIIVQTLAQHLGVHYLYEVEVDSLEARSTPTEVYPTVKTLQVLSPNWLRRFHNALIELDQEEMLALIADLPPSQAPLAQSLSRKVQDFDYEMLLDLIQAILSR